MQVERLVAMANQIADYFRAEPDRKEAEASTATHLRRYWDPRMRKQILAHLAESSGSGLNDIALAGVKILAEQAEAQQAAPRR